MFTDSKFFDLSVRKKMAEELFSNGGVCGELLQYLDFASMIAVDESEILKFDTSIYIKHAFCSYLDEWSSRQDSYGWPIKQRDETFVGLDGSGWCKYTLIKVTQQCKHDIEEYLPYLSVLRIDKDTNDKVNEYQYGDCIQAPIPNTSDALTDAEYELSSKKVTEFDSVDVDKVIEALPYSVERRKDQICQLLGISMKNQCKLDLKNMINKWYLSQVHRKYIPGYWEWEDILGLFGWIKYDLVPSEWKKDVEIDEEIYDEINESHFFVVFLIRIHEAMP